jgi:UDP-N-acetyl-D-glucosamine dehydrogenase
MAQSSSSTSLAEALHAKLGARTARVGVVGLGYVGLPLAIEFARAGFRTTGIDLDPLKVAAIGRGESYIRDVPHDDVAHFQRAGRLEATADTATIAALDTINICVPTPLRKTKDPDLSYVVSAVEMIAEHLRPGQLVILESTTYPGTTDEVFLAFSPERVDPGNAQWTTRNVPKVVGGMTPACSRLARALYSASIDTVVDVSSPKVAEMVKLLENTFRAVNIGLVNELALMCDRLGISVWEVIDAAATKPFGFMPFYPGPGLGGHCIPIDPFYLSWKARQFGFESRFIELAGHINGGMPRYVVDRVGEALNSVAKPIRGSKVHLIGMAYKPDVTDYRESPAIDVADLLERRGAIVTYSDHFVPEMPAEHGHKPRTEVPFDKALAAGFDIAVITTNHKTFDYDALVAKAPLILDTRNALKGRTESHIFRL